MGIFGGAEGYGDIVTWFVGFVIGVIVAFAGYLILQGPPEGDAK
jgi:hypothetical protein